jgi:hypothetical protein
MITCAAVRPTPGDLIQPVDRLSERGDLLLDLGLQLSDVGAGLVDTAKHPGQQEAVMVAEVAGEGLLQLAELGTQATAGQLGQRLGVALAGDQRGQHGSTSMARPDTPKMSEATTDSLI